MLKYISGILTGICAALLVAVLLSPRVEDMNDTWRGMI